MANIAIFRINYKSDFILTLNSDAGWMTPFCIKFWTGAPSQAYFVGYDGTTYTHCAPVAGEPTKLLVQFDDHHLPIGDLKFQIGYHFTVADFPTSVEDEVINQASVIIEVDDAPAQVMLDLNGETAPEIQFSLPAYANEAQRIANEEQRIANETQRIGNEETRIQHEESRISAEQTRQQNEQQRINQEQARVNEFAVLKRESEQATTDANNAAENARQKAQLAQDKATLAQTAAQLANDKAALAQAAAQLANDKAQLAADKAALAQAASQLCDEKAALAQQKATYAQQQGDYSKAQGDYAKEQGDYSKAQGDYSKEQGDYSKEQGDYAKDKGDICAADHQTAVADHQTATADHQTAAADHQTATTDHNQAGNDHTRAESDHTRAESDHAAVEVYVDSLGAFDISAYNATGGVLAEYADLTAALGTNGANIPDALRKGGMSVKFVQSSDHNYVQYLYVGTSTSVADFTNTDNWQKMNLEDEVSEINNAKLETFNKEEYKVTVFSDWHPEGESNGSYNKENGTWRNDATNIKSTRIDVTGYKQVRFLGLYMSSSSQLETSYAFQDENGDLVTGYPKRYQKRESGTSVAITGQYILDIPSGAKYLVIVKTFYTIIGDGFYCYLRNGTSVSDRYGNVNRINLNLNSTVAGFLLEAGTISGGAPNYVKKYDIPEGVKKIYFNGHFVSNELISLYWIKNAQGTIISHRISASTEDLHNFEIDLSELEGATQIWTNSDGVPNYIDSEIKVADKVAAIEKTESVVKSDNIMNSLFFEDLDIASRADGYLGEDGEVKSSPAGGVIKKFNIPAGTPCLYFTARASFNYMYSVYWIVDNQGNVLKHQACSTSTPNYNNLLIDLTGITGSYQLWTNGFSSSTYNIELTISAYNYNSDVNRRLGKLEEGAPLMAKAPEIIDSLFFYDNKKVVATELGSLKNDGTIYTPYGNEVRKFDIPTGVDKIYFSGKSNYGAAYYSFSSYWIVDENGNMLAHESLSTTPQTYNNHEIDLSGLTGAKQLWTFIMDAYISYYDYTQRVQKDLPRNNQWYGKTIVWLGTSVPWGQSSEAQAGTTRVNPYPYQVCNALGATLIDSTRGGLAQMANYDNDSGLWYPKTYGSTCLTTAECTAAKNAGLVSTDLSAYSYQNTLLGKDADLYIFDVEPNNNDTGSSDDLALFDFYQWKYTDNSTFASHRNTYIGALLYEIDQILTEKPNASFVFIGEHIPWESASAFDTWGVRTVTQALCEKLHAHYINLAEKLCYNGKNKSVWINSDNVHPKQAAYDRMAKMLINELLLIA